MPEIIHLPPFPMPAKPREGAACNGCGFCCHSEVCRIGIQYFNTDVAPCPGIIYHGGRVLCAVVIGEAELVSQGKIEKPVIREALGIDTYCDSTDVRDR